MELDELRRRIDGIDCQLTALFKERMDVSALIAKYKRENGLEIQNTQRENDIKSKVASMLPEELEHYGELLYDCIFDLSRSYQKRIAGRFGLLGGKLSHSYSPLIHSYLGSYEYKLYEKSPDELEEFLQSGSFDGLNVTIPYKKAVIPYCARLSDTAKKLGSVNTIVRMPDGSLFGDNTDYYGFNYLIKKSGLELSGKTVLVLGSGGASVTVCAALRDLHADVTVISRTGEDNYNNLDRHSDAKIIVNTTPLGMYPGNGAKAVDLRQFHECEAVFDIVYNPARTALMLQAEELGIPCFGGLYMLVAQAVRSSEIFCDNSIRTEVIERVHRRISAEMQNIVLIGMPGCGKSTIAGLLSEKLGKPVYDADILIVERAGKSIPDIFEQDGEEEFRALERELLSELGKNSGSIIATGGGCVTDERNYAPLHQNSVIILLERLTDKLEKAGRPISMKRDLNELWSERKALYERFADYCVDNNGEIEDTLDAILEALNENSCHKRSQP